MYKCTSVQIIKPCLTVGLVVRMTYYVIGFRATASGRLLQKFNQPTNGEEKGKRLIVVEVTSPAGFFFFFFYFECLPFSEQFLPKPSQMVLCT